MDIPLSRQDGHNKVPTDQVLLLATKGLEPNQLIWLFDVF
jgi:hypothetical protein